MLSTWETSSAIQARIEKNIEDLTDKRDNLEEEVEKLTSTHLLFRQLRDMGFGLKELKLLFYTVKEVAAENKIPEDKAVQKFLEDIEKNYDTILGYEERIKSDIEKTNRELVTLRSELGFNKEAVRVVTGLLSIGFTYQQILNLADLAWFLQSINVNLQADVNKYGSFKKALAQIKNQEIWKVKKRILSWTSWTSENPLLEVDIGDIRR